MSKTGATKTQDVIQDSLAITSRCLVNQFDRICWPLHCVICVRQVIKNKFISC